MWHVYDGLSELRDQWMRDRHVVISAGVGHRLYHEHVRFRLQQVSWAVPASSVIHAKVVRPVLVRCPVKRGQYEKPDWASRRVPSHPGSQSNGDFRQIGSIRYSSETIVRTMLTHSACSGPLQGKLQECSYLAQLVTSVRFPSLSLQLGACRK